MRHEASVLLDFAIRPALYKLRLWTPAAEELLLGTAIVESDLRHRRQFAPGPARGLFQMEPRTHKDIWKNFLAYKAALREAVDALRSSPSADGLTELEHNDTYAAALARIHYLRAPAPLPLAGDVAGMAMYWKQYYNTWRGKGEEAKYMAKWYRTMG